MSQDHICVDSYPLLIRRLVSKQNFFFFLSFPFFSFLFLSYFCCLEEAKPRKRGGYDKNYFNPRKSHIQGSMQLSE